MPDRDPESIAFEAQYWLQINTLLRDAHLEIVTVAELIVESSTATGELAVQSLRYPDLYPSIKAVASMNTAALAVIKRMQEKIVALGELAEGRVTVLLEEAGIDEDPSTEGDQDDQG